MNSQGSESPSLQTQCLPEQLTGLLKRLFPLPLPAPKRVQERVAALALPRQSGHTLLIHLGWGAYCQAERLLSSSGAVDETVQNDPCLIY